MDIQAKANKICMELECEATGELAAIHTSTGVKNYIFSTENMTKLEESFKQVSIYTYKVFPLILGRGVNL